jgi:uncharacterized protein YqcC (DUF446 family)
LAIDLQQHLDHSDLLLGRMTRALDSSYTTVARAQAMINERDEKLKQKDEEVKKHLARIAELEAIIEDIAADEDEEDDSGSDDSDE